MSQLPDDRIAIGGKCISRVLLGMIDSFDPPIVSRGQPIIFKYVAGVVEEGREFPAVIVLYMRELDI